MDDHQLNQSSESISERSRKQLIHFSNGTVEQPVEESAQFSDDENSVSADSTILRWIDWLGEKLAWGLGISSPKYYYVIERAKLNSKYDSVMLGDMDDPHVSILQNPVLTGSGSV